MTTDETTTPQTQDTHAAGYAEAVARLRDDERYTNWWTSSDAKPDGRIRQHLADYLEAVGPDGVDVPPAEMAVAALSLEADIALVRESLARFSSEPYGDLMVNADRAAVIAVGTLADSGRLASR